MLSIFKLFKWRLTRFIGTITLVLLCCSTYGEAKNAPRGVTIDGVSFLCAPTPVNIVDKNYDPGGWNFNRELAANTFAVYAVASYDAYEPRGKDKSRAFRFDDDHPDLRGDPAYGSTGWRRAEERHSNLSGLSYDVYYRDSANMLEVLTSFRGTDGWFNVDLIANLSWLTQWINPWDQYRQARYGFFEVLKRAVKVANGKSVSFTVVGHSLGGGLAQYVAHTHPCTAAVVFNASPVTNTWLTRSRNDAPLVIRIYVEGDAFEMLAPTIKNTPSEAVYRFSRRMFDPQKTEHPEFIYQHNMESIAATMARMAIACSSRKDCEISDKAVLARTLYCARYWGYRWNTQPVLREATYDKICS